jgi:hypothetical protein
MSLPLRGGPRRPSLPYRQPQQGRDYWIVDGILPNAQEVVDRSLARTEWERGLPHRPETWPGMRASGALLPDELTAVEARVCALTGARRLWKETDPQGATLNHNVIQMVAASESGPRPHTDSRVLCRFAAVIYLTPGAPVGAGTTFYRLRYPDGTLSGNLCPAPHVSLRDALGVATLPLQAWHPELSVPNVFNRMLLYRADMVHSATAYFGKELKDRRMTAVFFWMAV